jgi:hypothetical protein
MTVYPAQIDTNTTLPKADNLTPVNALVYNRLQEAIIAIEQELGVKPSGIYSTVRTRLDTLDNTINNLNAVKLGGDIGGTVTIPLVIGLQGRPLSNSLPGLNNVIIWDGISWKPGPNEGLPGPPGPQGPAGSSLPHNLLDGLQGGNSIDGYYHLTSQEHTWLIDGYTAGYWSQSKGGTNQTSYSTGDLLYANGSGNLTKLNATTDGYILTLDAGLPSWKTITIPNSAKITITSGAYTSVPSSYDGYLMPDFSINTEQLVTYLVNSSGTLKDLRIYMDSVAGAGENASFTVMVNFMATNIVATLTDENKNGSDLVHSLAVVAGDLISIRITTSSGATAGNIIASLNIEL